MPQTLVIHFVFFFFFRGRHNEDLLGVIFSLSPSRSTEMIEIPITNCRLCKGDALEDVIDLGRQVITSRFPSLGDTSTPKVRAHG